MSAVVPDLFKGVAVVIDNGIGREELVDRIIGNIRTSGGHVIEWLALPTVEYDLEHFARVSFFIMDWNLKSIDGVPVEDGVQMPAALAESMVAENIEFLQRISASRHAPVVIFTNQEPQEVLDALAADPELHRRAKEEHILIRRKTEVVDKLYEVLENWAKETPSVLTLKTWERSYLKAANDLFVDLHDRHTFWPVMMWQTFNDDETPPAMEMGRLLNRLVESRMGPLDLDLSSFIPVVEDQKAMDEAGYRASMYKVLEGERFVRDARLPENLWAPGDVFSYAAAQGNTTYWMNIRAECDCLRGGDDLQLYLIQVKPVEDAEGKVDPKFGNFTTERDNEAIVYAMFDGVTFSIRFKDMKLKTVKDIKKEYKRVGRLLPPFLTRVQQRYASYVQRPGVPRVPTALSPIAEEPQAAAE